MSTPESTRKIPDKQKAWLVTGKGEPAQVLRFDQGAPVPSKLAPGEVLIKVQAAALNPVYAVSLLFSFESLDVLKTSIKRIQVHGARPHMAVKTAVCCGTGFLWHRRR